MKTGKPLATMKRIFEDDDDDDEIGRPPSPKKTDKMKPGASGKINLAKVG